MTAPATCFCGEPVYGAQSHPCCEFWRSNIEQGYPCPACSASRAARRYRRPHNPRTTHQERTTSQ